MNNSTHSQNRKEKIRDSRLFHTRKALQSGFIDGCNLNCHTSKMSFGGQTPTIIVLKEGTDASQGKGQIISNIQACLAVQDTVRSTLGPYGGDLLLVDENGRQTITNDGATVMKVCEA